MLNIMKKLKKSIINKNNMSLPFINLEIDDYIKLEIKEECDFLNCSNALDNFKDLEIPIRLFNIKGHNISDYKFEKQIIYILKKKNIKFLVTIGENNIKISQNKVTNELIYETVVEIIEEKLIIHKYVHDLNHSTKIVKWYPDENPVNKYFTLTKEEAILLFQNLVNNLKSFEKIETIFSVETLEKHLNLLENNKVLKHH